MAFVSHVMEAGGEPYDPAVFLTTEPQWSTGDVVVLGRDKRFRILDIAPSTAEARAELDVVAVWTVEPLP
jgi:hypothetical protein